MTKFATYRNTNGKPVMYWCDSKGEIDDLRPMDSANRFLIERGVGVKGVQCLLRPTLIESGGIEYVGPAPGVVIEIEHERQLIDDEDTQLILDSIPPGYSKTVRKLLFEGPHGVNAEFILQYITSKALELRNEMRVREERGA